MAIDKKVDREEDNLILKSLKQLKLDLRSIKGNASTKEEKDELSSFLSLIGELARNFEAKKFEAEDNWLKDEE